MARTKEAPDAPRLATRLKEIREAKGLSQAAVARLANVTQQHYSRLERGTTRLNDRLMVQLSEALICDPIDLLDQSRIGTMPGTLNVAGYVQGGKIQHFEPGDGDHDMIVEAPFGAQERGYEALRVKGDSMEPVYVDGDTVIVARPSTNLSEAWYRDCVVRMPDKSVMLKRVIPGSTKNLITLQSYHSQAEDIEDVEVESVAPVVWVRRG